VILYADTMGRAMESAISQTIERRQKQMVHNEKHGITPRTIQKPLPIMGIEAEQLLAGTAGKGVKGGKRFVGGFTGKASKDGRKDLIKNFELGAGAWGDDVLSNLSQPNQDEFDPDTSDSNRLIIRLRKEMDQAASRLDFEKAADIRDRIFQLENSKSN
jgi:excinuclease ABC subunit B